MLGEVMGEQCLTGAALMVGACLVSGVEAQPAELADAVVDKAAAAIGTAKAAAISALAESRLALAHNATRVVLVEIGVARPTGRAEAKAKVAASARDWEEEEVMTVEL